MQSVKITKSPRELERLLLNPDGITVVHGHQALPQPLGKTYQTNQKPAFNKYGATLGMVFNEEQTQSFKQFLRVLVQKRNCFCSWHVKKILTFLIILTI